LFSTYIFFDIIGYNIYHLMDLSLNQINDNLDNCTNLSDISNNINFFVSEESGTSHLYALDGNIVPDKTDVPGLTGIPKIYFFDEIYDLVDDAIKTDFNNKYIKGDVSLNENPDTLFEFEGYDLYGLNKKVCMKVLKLGNDLFSIYKYKKNDNFYYITFDKITKKYTKLLSNDENVKNYDILSNSTIIFESENWDELFKNVVLF